MSIIPKDPMICDLLVLGSGIAGLRAAIEAAQARWHVLVVTKDSPRESNTEYAQGGIAVPLADDDLEKHFNDTLEAGDGLCDPQAVEVLVQDGRERVQELIDWGAEFDRDDGRLNYTREAAHSRSRILHAHGDATGRELERALSVKAERDDHIRLMPFHTGISLITGTDGARGAWVLDEADNRPVPILARAVLIATGGVGRLFQESTNPAVATGDGIAMAMDAGLVMANLEFVQFHPTVLFLKNAPRFLLSESMRGEGAVLRNADGRRFMKSYHPMGDLAPRDVVTRGVVSEIRKQGGRPVTLDMTHLDGAFVSRRFPTIYSTCLGYGLDITRHLIPVHPAAHYMMGGVETDREGRTSMPHVFAAGEASCTGVHGANRLASNSLLEGLVFGTRAARAAPARSARDDPIAAPWNRWHWKDARTSTCPTSSGGASPRSCGKGSVSYGTPRRFGRPALNWRGSGDCCGTAVFTGVYWRRPTWPSSAMPWPPRPRTGRRAAEVTTVRIIPKTDDVKWRRHSRLVKDGESFIFREDPRV